MEAYEKRAGGREEEGYRSLKVIAAPKKKMEKGQAKKSYSSRMRGKGSLNQSGDGECSAHRLEQGVEGERKMPGSRSIPRFCPLLKIPLLRHEHITRYIHENSVERDRSVSGGYIAYETYFLMLLSDQGRQPAGFSCVHQQEDCIMIPDQGFQLLNHPFHFFRSCHRRRV